MASVSSRLIGKGEIVPRRYELEAARREFFAVLWELVPEALDAIFEMSRRRMEGPERTWAARQWQATYRLPDEWAYRATRMPPGVEEDFVLLNPVSIYEGRERECDPRDGTTVIFPGGSRYVLRSGMIRDSDSYAILIAHLLYEDPDGGRSGRGMLISATSTRAPKRWTRRLSGFYQCLSTDCVAGYKVSSKTTKPSGTAFRLGRCHHAIISNGPCAIRFWVKRMLRLPKLTACPKNRIGFPFQSGPLRT